MIEPPLVTNSEPLIAASLRLRVSLADIQKVMGPGIQEVYATLSTQGVAPTGPWFTHHFQRPTDVFDFEICVPVAAAITTSGRVQPGTLRAAQVAKTVYHGDYSGLGNAWGEFHQWINAQGLATADDFWERYLVGPESSPDPANWRTELNQPLAGPSA